MKFVRDEFNDFKVDLKEALKELEEKYSINVEIRGIHYNDVTFDCDLHIKKTDIDADRFEWNKICEFYGLKAEYYNAVIEIDGKRYQLKSIDTRKRKYPIICSELDTDNLVAFTLDIIKTKLNNLKV